MASVLGLFADWFHFLRWAGVAYLGYLAYRHWTAPIVDIARVAPVTGLHRRRFLEGTLIAATNPKTLLFYAAFLPQFVDPGQPALAQMAVLGATYVAIALTFDSAYALAAARLKPLFASRRAAIARNRMAAGFLGGAAVWLAFTRRQGA